VTRSSRGPRRRLGEAPTRQTRRARRAAEAPAASTATLQEGAGPAPAAPLRVVLPTDPGAGPDVESIRQAAAAGATVEVEVLVAQIADDEERFLESLGALDEILAAAPSAPVAIIEASAATYEVAAQGALLAEVAYRHAAPVPIPLVDELVPTCNNRCVHCAVADLRAQRPGGDPAAMDRALAKLAAGGATRVMFGVAELSLHPEFLNLLAAARRHGFRAVHVATNGRSFAVGDLAVRAVAAGATHFQVSLHGPDAVTHEGISGVPGSFAETVAGMRRLKAAGAEVVSNTVVCRRNLERLEPLLDCVAAVGVRHALLGQLAVNGRARERAEELLVPLATAAPRMVRAAEHGEALGLSVGLAGVPYCLAPGAERFLGVDDLLSVYDVVPGESASLKVPFVRPRPCVRCAAYAICRGISERYLRLLGSDELRPLPGPRATRRPRALLADFYASPAEPSEEPPGAL
jgi:hypothetical protein